MATRDPAGARAWLEQRLRMQFMQDRSSGLLLPRSLAIQVGQRKRRLDQLDARQIEELARKSAEETARLAERQRDLGEST